MSKLNGYLSSVISGANRCFQLPRPRTLGSRYFNLVVASTRLDPNLADAAEAAAPGADQASSQVIRPAEDQVSTLTKPRMKPGTDRRNSHIPGPGRQLYNLPFKDSKGRGVLGRERK